MAIREISFPSYNGRDTIQGWIYTPIVQPRAVIQIVHGFGEHSRRYLHLILRLLDEGFVVCADDHVGHGKTAAAGDTWGDYGYKGYATTTEDEFTLYRMVTGEFPGLPFYMFGHSWGSMIARDYAAKHGDTLAGLILCGTVSLRENTAAMKAKLKALLDEGKGSEVMPELLGELLGGFTVRYEDAASPNNWIATDPGVVRDHGADPFNNFKAPTTQSLYDFTDLWTAICCPQWACEVPDIPIYVIAGDQDPVGNFGEGVYQAANWLWGSGKRRVKTQIYSGYRHEIHNEPEIREQVEQGIVDFLQTTF